MNYYYLFFLYIYDLLNICPEAPSAIRIFSDKLCYNLMFARIRANFSIQPLNISNDTRM